MNLHWEPREVTRYVDIIENGEKKTIKTVKLYLDFTITTNHGNSYKYTAHVYSDGSNRPEIRIKDPNGDAKDPEKPVSRTLDGFAKANPWLREALPVIISGVTDAHADKLARSITRWQAKRDQKKAA